MTNAVLFTPKKLSMPMQSPVRTFGLGSRHTKTRLATQLRSEFEGAGLDSRELSGYK